MNFKISPLLLFITIFLLVSCGKDDTAPNSNEVSFTLRSIDFSSGRTAQNALENAASILVTIANMDGSPTDYTLEKIQLYTVNDEFISEKITMNLGEYELVEFFVLDGNDNITHITPLEGSEQAQNVTNPLPIQFTVAANEVTSVTVEVISSESLSLEDFGLTGFSLTEINLFQFLISVSEQGNLQNLLDGTLTITAEDYSFTKALSAIANNSIVIKDGYADYQITIQSDGYNTFSHLFSRDSLSHYQSNPLHIELTNDSENVLVDGRDGQSYQIVQVGTQLWMAENLRATVYNDGTAIEFPRTNITAWENNTSGAYAMYNYDETEYGLLYNWYAVNTGKLCPEGWHIPTDDDWLTLSTFLGGTSVAGGKMKVTGTELWQSPNTEASNSSGFSAYPAGWAYFCCGHFSYKGTRAVFWSSSEGIDADHGISRHLEHDTGTLIRYGSSNSSNKGNGFSCRCVKD